MAEQKEVKHDPDISCWGTSTELAGSAMERTKYFMLIRDHDKPDLRVILVRGPGVAVAFEPYVEHEYDYDQYDDDDDYDDYEE